MTAIQSHVGVVSTGIYLPAQYHTAEHVAQQSGVPQDIVERKLGFRRKPIPGPEDGTAQMGIWAARQAVQRAGLTPSAIDLVIYIGEEYKEMQLWTAGIKTAHEVGATGAWAFDVALRCGTWVLGMKLAEALMISSSDIQTVLLAGGYRNGDLIRYTNPRVRFMYNLGAGGGAMLLQKDYGRNRVLGSEIRVDGSLSDTVGVLGGGTRVGFHHHDEDLYQLDVLDPDTMRTRLAEVSMANFMDVIRKACARGGYTPNQIDYLALLHMKRSAHEGLLAQLGLSQNQSTYLEDFGHIGQIDQILSIHVALEQGRIKDGDLVVGASAGVGYAWGATAIKWGPV